MAAEGPPHVEVVRRFVNTVDLESGEDALADGEALRAWAVGEGHLSASCPRFHEPDVVHAVAVREALRDLLADHADEPAVARLNEAAATAPMLVRVVDGHTAELEPAATGVDALVARILAAVVQAMLDGSWPRLKVCRLETCRWAFWDASKNRSGSWCSMAVCGNRAKASAYRARRRQHS